MSLSGTEWDHLLRSALLEAQRQDWADILEDETTPQFSRRYLSCRKRLCANPFTYSKRVSRPLWIRAMRFAAGIALILAISAGGILAVSPEARAWVRQVIFEWYDDHFDIEFVGEGPEKIRPYDLEPSYLPEGFEVVMRDDPDDSYCTTVYGNNAGEVIFFDRGMDVIQSDNEHGTFYEITVNGNDAMLKIANDPGGWNAVIWADESVGILFRILSTYDCEELITNTYLKVYQVQS